jgi:acyl carrier protein
MTGPQDAHGTAATVRKLVSEIAGHDALKGADDNVLLFERRLLDSLNLVTIVCVLEEQFDIEVTPEDIVPENFRSITDMARFVALKRSAVPRTERT